MYYGREKSNVSSFIRLMDGNRRGRKNHLPLLLRRESTCFAAFLHICECFWLYITILPFMSSTYVLGQIRAASDKRDALLDAFGRSARGHTDRRDLRLQERSRAVPSHQLSCKPKSQQL